MNVWFSNIFEGLLSLMHVIVILGLVIFFFISWNKSYDWTTPVFYTFVIFTIYTITIGTITTLISINKTLQRVEDELKKQTIHLQNSGAGTGKNSKKTESSIDAFNRGEI